MTQWPPARYHASRQEAEAALRENKVVDRRVERLRLSAYHAAVSIQPVPLIATLS